MKVIYKKKIYQGKVELRDYELRKLLLDKESVKIWVGDEYMDLTYRDLKTKGSISNTQYSIINEGQTYRLIGFDWKPIKDLDRASETGSVMAKFTEEQMDVLRKIFK